MTMELKGVVKKQGADTHIHEIDLALAETGFNVLLGATNAGKTTLIKLMAGLEQPSAGEIWFGGRNMTRLSPRRRNVSLVHQFFVNYPHLSVFENIASPLRVAGVARADLTRRVEETAELLRLTPMLDRAPGKLSGGQQQRTALARAIVKDSDIVLLDEPLANLDYKLREELRDELPRLFADRGAILVYATSEPMEALLLGGSTAALKEGRLTQFGPTAQVYRQPQDLLTAQVFSDPPINTARIQKRGDSIRLGDVAHWTASGPITSAPDGAYTLGVRPNNVSSVALQKPSARIDGKVLVTELTGSESAAHFGFGDGLAWVSQNHGVHPYEVGERRSFFIDVERCLYFTESGVRIGASA